MPNKCKGPVFADTSPDPKNSPDRGVTVRLTGGEGGSVPGELKAPFPWFGGKSRAASIIWPRLGPVVNYVEPFAGSLALLLARPQPFSGSETVNDINGYLCNFWRSVTLDPHNSAVHAAWPVSECDLIARHSWLRAQEPELSRRLKDDPEFHDPKIAGWWVWGLSCWIGSGFCSSRAEQLPHLGDAGRGVVKKLPHLGDAGRGVDHTLIEQWFRSLSARLTRVRIACGDWTRVLGPSVTEKHGVTGIVLDPPYDTEGCDDVYQTGSMSSDVREWAIANGNNRLLRIVLCGYEGEHTLPSDWTCVAWKARGGMGSQGDGRGRDNAARERLWFSPYCLGDSLFDLEVA